VDGSEEGAEDRDLGAATDADPHRAEVGPGGVLDDAAAALDPGATTREESYHSGGVAQAAFDDLLVRRALGALHSLWMMTVRGVLSILS